MNNKDQSYREFALNGNMWKVVFHVGIPLALYQSLHQLFRLFDSVMASYISSQTVSTVAYLSALNMTLAAIGGGLAIGSSLKISEAFGAGDHNLVKKRVSTLLFYCTVISLLILLVIPFVKDILIFTNTPIEMVELGTRYFQIELVAMVFSFYANAFIAIERARGNASLILKLNFISIGIKLSLTALFVYVLDGTIIHLGISSCISYLFLVICAVIRLKNQETSFSFSFSSISFDRDVSHSMLKTSTPVIVEKGAFQFGKAVVNSMSTHYGNLTVGALGISNNLGGITTNPQNGFQEAGAAIISQNMGANKKERALDAFKKILIIDVALGIIGCFLTLIFLPQLTQLFATSSKAYDPEFAKLIKEIYFWEAWGAIPLGINAAVMALLYGLGYTKLTLCINVARIFLYRIPVLWLLQNFTNVGSKSVGLVMGISNTLSGITAAIVAIILLIKIYKEENINFLKLNS